MKTYFVLRMSYCGGEMSEELQGHRDLKAWQSAMDFAVHIYGVSRMFPPLEQRNLTSQVQRAVVSIPSNIAEGYGRHSAKELHRFLNTAIGSLLEVETQIELAERLGYITPAVAAECIRRSTRLKQLLKGLRNWAEKQPSGWVPSVGCQDRTQAIHTNTQPSFPIATDIRNTKYAIRKKES
ncbi:MAG: four helix bundle protein [Terriglobales bacterium]